MSPDVLASCGPAWIERGLAELYALHPRLMAESRAIHAKWWPHLCTGWEVLPTATYDGKATLGLCWVKPPPADPACIYAICKQGGECIYPSADGARCSLIVRGEP